MKAAFALFDIIKAIAVRLVLLIHSLLAIWRVVSIANDNFYWWFAIVDVALVLEGLIAVVIRKGMDYKWFCPCFLLYLGGTVPAIWLLELDRRQRFINDLSTTNTTNTSDATAADNRTSTSAPQEVAGENSISIYGVTLPVSIDLEPDTWVVIIEQLLLYFMILGRWLLPRGKISRNELSQLLFVFIGMASDITELFTLFDETPVRQSIELTYIILIMWSVSLLQFCFVLTATKNPNRPRVALASTKDLGRKLQCATCCGTELWSIFVLMLMQDLPFLVIRTYTIVALHLITYSIIFFTAKNILIVLLLVYRVVVICFIQDKDDDDENETEIKSSNVDKTVCTPKHSNNHDSISVIEYDERHYKHNKPQKPRHNHLQNHRIHCPIPKSEIRNDYQKNGFKQSPHALTARLVLKKHYSPRQYLYHPRGGSLGSL